MPNDGAYVVPQVKTGTSKCRHRLATPEKHRRSPLTRGCQHPKQYSTSQQVSVPVSPPPFFSSLPTSSKPVSNSPNNLFSQRSRRSSPLHTQYGDYGAEHSPQPCGQVLGLPCTSPALTPCDKQSPKPTPRSSSPAPPRRNPPLPFPSYQIPPILPQALLPVSPRGSS